MSPNAGGGGELRGLSANEYVQLYTGAQINFGDLTLYLTYDTRSHKLGPKADTVLTTSKSPKKNREHTPYLMVISY